VTLFWIGLGVWFVLFTVGTFFPDVLMNPRMWWCFSGWSRHRIVTRWRLTQQSEKLTCSCGRSYGMNHDAQAILPWDKVKELYDGPGSILRP